MSLSLLIASAMLFGHAQGAVPHGSGHITVQVDRPGVKVSPTFYGLMTEEINHAYDGGLYAELIQNRDFKDSRTEPIHWSIDGGTMELDDSDPIPGTALDRCLKVTPAAKVETGTHITNEGFWGVPILPNTTYELSFYAKGDPSGKSVLRPILSSPSGRQQPEFAYAVLTPTWQQYHLKLRTGGGKPAGDGRFSLAINSPGPIWITQVSLFPPTFHTQKNGFRKDLIDLLGGMKPSFLRLPGGNYLEGDTIETRFDWKKTLGPIEDRPGHQGTWGYRSSDGLGLYEFMVWCDDIHVQPVLAVWAGYALRQQHVNPGPDLAPYVQDALDEIEFVTGGTDTKWGAERAKLGHPRPWKLTYVEIGNEDAFDQSRTYDRRYAQFYDAIKAKYPQLHVIATAEVRSRKPDVVDEHYYRTAAAMARDAAHYDRYDRNGPKIFVGEWASIEGRPTPTYKAALGDAAWLTGLERNSDLVVMESYAPLLVNVNRGGSQWPTNLIGYDNLTAFGSPAYYVQALFGNNTGDTVLPTRVASTPADKHEGPAHGAVGLGTWITRSEYKDLTVEGDGIHYSQAFASGSEGWTFPRGSWAVQDGAVRQTTMEEDTAAIGGDPAWTDYTLSVRARKISGNEGFLVRFHVHDAHNYWQWNVGGWGDSRTALQLITDDDAEEIGRASNATVETGKWYDVKIHVGGGRIECYLDGKLISTAREAADAAPEPIYAAASRVSASGEVILKIVNVSDSPMDTTIELPGAGELDSVAKGWEMAGDPASQNTVAEPKKVAPRAIVVGGVSRSFRRTFPPFSVTVLRLRRK